MRRALSVLITLLVFPQAFAKTGDEKAAYPAISAQADVRQVVFSSALVIAGYNAPDDDPDVQTLRAAVVKTASEIDPGLRSRLQEFYRSHRRAKIDEPTDALRYRALAVMVNEPPSFRFDVEEARIPEDVRPIVGFESLAGELYRTPAFRKVLPQIIDAFDATTARVARQIAPTVTSLVTYFRTKPLDRLDIAAVHDTHGKIIRPAVTRYRRVKVFVDPLVATRALAVRGDLFDGGTERDYQRIGDRFAVFGGPNFSADEAALRLAVIRFIVDPVVVAHRDDMIPIRDQIDQLLTPNVEAIDRYGDAPLVLATDSLVSAANARFLVRAGRLSENGALAYLGDARDRGEVLAIHFYERLKQFEQTGLDLSAFYPDFAHSFDMQREMQRDAQIAAARAAVEREPKPPSAADVFASDILLADRYISEKRFDDARPILERVLKTSNDNARALFGLAQVIENSPDPIEKDAKSTDEDRINAQAERLESAVNLYRRAALGASSKELWLASWSHVYAGRILDFLELREEAVAEYNAAIKVGDVAQGAFKEARAGLAAPYTPTAP